MGGEKLRAQWYILLGLWNKAKQKSKLNPLSFHPCLAMKVPLYLQACWQYFRMVHHTPSPLEQQTLSVLWDNYSLDCTSQRFCIKHFYRKKIFEICESLSLSDKDEFWLIFFFDFHIFCKKNNSYYCLKTDWTSCNMPRYNIFFFHLKEFAGYKFVLKFILLSLTFWSSITFCCGRMGSCCETETAAVDKPLTNLVWLNLWFWIKIFFFFFNG